MVERDPRPWGEDRPDRSLDPQDDPRIPHPNTMARRDRRLGGWLMFFVMLAWAIGLGMGAYAVVKALWPT